MHLMRFLPCLWLLAGSALVQGLSTFQGSIASNDTLSPQAFASLTSVRGEQKAPITVTKSFTFFGLEDGDYVLRVWDFKYSFLIYAIRLAAHSPPSIHVYQLGSESFIPSDVPSLPYPLVVPVLDEKHYEPEPTSFDPIKMIRSNPLILMMIVGGALAVGMPMILKWIDPEVMKEVEQNQADLHAKVASFGNVDITESLSKRLASSGSGSGASTPAQQVERKPSPSPAVTPSKSGGGGGGGNKNRKKK